MSNGMNKATLVGNIGNDPELRSTQSGQSVLKFRLATTETYVDGNKERKDVTHWHNIVLWGPRAEGLSKILIKGTKVLVEGRIEYREYEKDGVKRNAVDINARELLILAGGARSEGDSGGTRAPQSAPAQRAQQSAQRPQQPARGQTQRDPARNPPQEFSSSYDDDDIPF